MARSFRKWVDWWHYPKCLTDTIGSTACDRNDPPGKIYATFVGITSVNLQLPPKNGH